MFSTSDVQFQQALFFNSTFSVSPPPPLLPFTYYMTSLVRLQVAELTFLRLTLFLYALTIQHVPQHGPSDSGCHWLITWQAFLLVSTILINAPVHLRASVMHLYLHISEPQ